jgi:RimJ/RimL family protein N-acetyltransferase
MIQLHSERLRFYEFSFDNIDQIHALHSIPETDEYNTLGIPGSIDDTRKIMTIWMNRTEPRTGYTFCMEREDTHEFIGLIAINLGKPNYRSAEIWYKTHKDHWNRGFTTEALKRILNYCFNDLKLHRVEAGCATENIASVKVLEKSGFKREGEKRKILPIRGKWVDNYFYAILEEDFLSI